MTVTTTLDRQFFDGDGANKNFPFNFRFFDNSDIYVYLVDTDGNATLKTRDVDYTVSGALAQDGGQVVFTVAPPLGTDNVYIQRILPEVQPTSIRNQGAFFPAVHEDAFDRMTMLIQQALAGVRGALSLNFLRTLWDFRGLRATNAADPINPQDLTTKSYVDTANGEQDSRIDSLSAGLPGTNHAFPWSTITTTGTKTLTPGFEFASAVLYINGIAQTYGRAFAVSGNQIVLAQAVPAGTEIYTILGQNVVPTPPTANAFDLFDYPDLRAYTGTASVIHIVKNGIEGFFFLTGSAGSDNKGTQIVDGLGRAWQRIYDGPINLKWFGARGDNSFDNAEAFSAAASVIGAYGSAYLPPGKYRTSGEFLNSAEGVTLSADNPWTTSIIQTNPALGIIRNTGMFFRMAGLCLDYTGTPTGSQALYSSGSYSVFENFLVRRGYDCVLFETGVAQRALNFNLLNYEYAGIRLRNLNDPFMDNFIINAGDNVKGRDGGIFLEEKVEALMCSNGDVLLGVNSFGTKVTTFGMNTRPAYNKFTNVYMDSAVNGAVFDNMVETDAVSSWFSGGRNATAGLSQPGATLKNVDGFRFTGGQAFNSGSHGVLVKANSKNVSFVNFSFESNSATAGDGVADGLSVESGAIGCTVIGGKASNGLYTGKQRYGIDIGANCVDFSVIGANLKGNLTGPMRDASTTTGKTILANAGYTTKAKGTGTVILGQTVVTITHGLAKTPTLADLSADFASSPTASGVTSLYITSINATTFQIVTNAAVTTNALSVSWKADIS